MTFIVFHTLVFVTLMNIQITRVYYFCLKLIENDIAHNRINNASTSEKKLISQCANNLYANRNLRLYK